MAEILKPDVCIVGAGDLGINLAIAARQRGLDTALIDRGIPEAGDPRQGSLHRAALRASAGRAEAIRSGARLGLDNATPKLNYKTIAEQAATLARATSPNSSAERLAALGVAVVKGEPEWVDRRSMRVGETMLKPGHTILATGAGPFVPELPGLAELPFFTPDTILANVRKLSHLLVVGGDAVALEWAQIYRRLGSDVTLVPHGALLPGHDGEMVSILLRQLREEGLVVLEGASVAAFLPRSQGVGVTLAHPTDDLPPLDISHVLLAAGRVPELDWIALEKAKLKRAAGEPPRLLLDDWGRTSHAGISAFGGAGNEENHHAALWLGERLLDRLAGRPTSGREVLLPRQVQTTPALAQVGALDTIDGLKHGQTVLRTNLAENDAARAQGMGQGCAKLVIDRRGKILGAAMVGEGAGEAIASLALVMTKGLNAADLASLPVTGTSGLAVLKDIGRQFANQRPLGGWQKRRAAMRRLLP